MVVIRLQQYAYMKGELLYVRALFPTASTSSLWHYLAFLPHSMVILMYTPYLVESHPLFTTIDLQLSFYRPLYYNSRAHSLLLQRLHTTSAIQFGGCSPRLHKLTVAFSSISPSQYGYSDVGALFKSSHIHSARRLTYN